MINIQPQIDKLEEVKKVLIWKIDGQFIHGIKPNTFLNLTLNRIKELYNYNN